MAFPFSVSGSFIIRAAPETTRIQKLLVSQTEALLWKRSDDVSIEGQTIISRPSFMAWFTAPGTNWHPMVPFDEVRVTISGDSSEAIVRYEFSTLRILKIVACATVGLVGFAEITSVGSEGVVKRDADGSWRPRSHVRLAVWGKLWCRRATRSPLAAATFAEICDDVDQRRRHADSRTHRLARGLGPMVW